MADPIERKPRRRVRKQTLNKRDSDNFNLSTASSTYNDQIDDGIYVDDPELDDEHHVLTKKVSYHKKRFNTRRDAARKLRKQINSIADKLKPAEKEEFADVCKKLQHRTLLSKNDEKEIRLYAVNKMLVRKVPIYKIAEYLESSTAVIYKDRKEIQRRMRMEAEDMDMNLFIGETMEFYTDIRAKSLQMADRDLPTNLKLASLRTALTATNDLGRFLNAAGVFDVLRFRPKENKSNDELDRLVRATEEILDKMSDETDEFDRAIGEDRSDSEFVDFSNLDKFDEKGLFDDDDDDFITLKGD